MSNKGRNKVKNTINQLILFLIVVVSLQISVVNSACARAEYLIGTECCPMCGPGYYVRRHCTEYTSTTCVPCPSQTYIDAPNGLVNCRSCTICDAGVGLTVKKACTSTSDALCKPLEGHYCTDPVKGGCQGAEKHTTCKPGQYIKQKGSASSDTLCSECGVNTYSNGSFTSCKPHTQCEAMGLEVITEGSSSNDTECGKRSNHTVTIICVVVVAIIALAAIGFGIGYFLKRKNTTPKKITPKEEKRKEEVEVHVCEETGPLKILNHLGPGETDSGFASESTEKEAIAL